MSTQPRRLTEIAGAFLKLGCISFGGPVAHLSYLRNEFVTRRRWLDDPAYADLVALCQFLPGPASSQLVFALGMQRAGVVGAFLASLCFTFPSAVLMILFAYGVTTLGDLAHAGWLHGLKVAAVAVVAQAVWGMGRKLCPDPARITWALGAAAVLILLPGAVTQLAVICLGGLTGWGWYRRDLSSVPVTAEPAKRHVWAGSMLVGFAVLLIVLPMSAKVTGLSWLGVFDSFYRAGALVFGGGHVVLPLLRAEVVTPGWISDDVFLAGYGAAQAVPGPLFTFAAYLGTIIKGGECAWWGGVGALFALFLPAWMLIGGALPFWRVLRSKGWAQAALRGANAAVVGVLLAALYHPVWSEGVTSLRDIFAVIVAFVLLEVCRLPAWALVLVASAAGHWIL